jgi:biotin transport system substrate-specific component
MISKTALRVNIEAIKIVLGVIFLFASAQITIPLEPVPITMQTVALMAIALTYANLNTALATVSSYLILGGLGVPIFAGHSFGISKLFGATGGYLIGFLPCVYIMHKISDIFGKDTIYKLFFNCLAGTAIVFVCGISWLASFIGCQQAIISGFLPFIIPGIVKAVLLTAILRMIGFFTEK